MRCQKENRIDRPRRFFRIAHGEDDLVAFFENFYELVRYHGYSEAGLFGMIPWEFEIATMLATAANERTKAG